MDNIPVKIEAGDGLAQLIGVLGRIASAMEKLAGAAPAPAAVDDPAPVEADAPATVDVEAPAPAAPEITIDQIRQRVVRLSAAGKKDHVRAIIKSYAESVSDLPADKYAEIWDKLDKLEG